MKALSLSAVEFGKEEAVSLASCGIKVQKKIISGDGTPKAPYLVELKFTNTSAASFLGIIRISCGIKNAASPFFLLPGFMVGTNRGDAPLNVDSKCARLRKGDIDFPASPYWFVRADRLSYPAALIYANSRVCGISGDVQPRSNQYAGYGCDIDGTVYYTLGWQNAPYLFTDSHTYEKTTTAKEQCISLAPNETVSVKVRVFDYPASDVLALNSAVRSVYSIYHEAPRKAENVRNAVKMLSGAIDENAWIAKERSYTCFVFDHGGEYETRLLPSISWTNGLSVAMPMLLASHRLKAKRMRIHALTFIQRVVDESLNEASGLPWESYSKNGWSNHGWWFDRLPVPGHTGYITGQTLYSILKAYEAEKRFADIEHDDWLTFVRKVLDKVETTCNGDGEFPYVFSEKTGAGLCYDSMGGAWCLAAAAYERLIIGRREGLSALLCSEKHYYDAYVSKLCCYGGPFDIDKQIDSEGVLAYIRAVKCLHMLTGEDHLMKHLSDAIEFELTFKFCYNSPVQTPPLNNGWSSCGGSITSVTNPHIHPMSSSIADELIYCWRNTGDEYIFGRLSDTVRWGLQTFNRYDGEYDYGKTGWMSERFCYSQGLLTERYYDGSPASTWFALMPWASSSIIEGLCGEVWEDKELRWKIERS